MTQRRLKGIRGSGSGRRAAEMRCVASGGRFSFKCPMDSADTSACYRENGEEAGAGGAESGTTDR